MVARTLTAWEYLNFGLPEGNAHRRGTLWVDNLFDDVMWQTASRVTPWHGSMTFSPMGCVVNFDCHMGTDRRADGVPVNKTAVMWSTLVGEYVGHDYLGRMILMTPMSRYTFVPGTGNGTWNLTETWVNQAWHDVEGAWRVVPAG